MHYSQYRKKDYNNRPHPGTPRPDLEEEVDINSNVNVSTERPQQHQRFSRSYHGKSHNSSRDNNIKLSTPRQSPIESSPKIIIWAKNEPFDFGILSPLPCPKIGINVLRKIAEYCRDKPGHFPQLSLNQFFHICKYKIQLANTELCTAYFRVFDIVSRPSTDWTLCKEDNSAGNNDDDESLEESRDVKFYKMLNQGYDANDEFKADTLQFLLFLYIQHFLRLHKKFSMMSHAAGNESWPTFLENDQQQPHLPNGSGNNAAATTVNCTVTPEQRHAEFLTANLKDIIDFLMIVHGKRDAFVNSDNLMEKKRRNHHRSGVNEANEEENNDRVPVAVVRALSLIIGAASIAHNREFKWLDECLGLPDIASRLDFNKTYMFVDKERLIKWLMSNLTVNPWGPSSVTIPQVPIPLMTGICSGDNGESRTGDVKENIGNLSEEIFKRNKIYWNTQSHPKAWTLISNVTKQTLLLDTLEPLSSLKIYRCVDSNIYIPGVYNMILIQKCYGLILNIGVATKVVKVMDCSNITLSGVGRLFIINDTTSSTFHLLTPTSPIICGNKNHQIQLAPYNTFYPDLPSHMRSGGFSSKIQKWNKPIELSSDGFPHYYSGSDSNVVILRAEQFKLTPFPFKSKSMMNNEDGTTENSLSSPFNSSIPSGCLPGQYQRQLNSTTKALEKVKKEVQTRLISPSKQFSGEYLDLIYKITLLRFKKWLKDTGNYEQVMGLVSLQKSLEQELSTPVLLSNQYDLACISKCLKRFFNISSSRSRSSVRRTTSPLYYGIRYNQDQQHQRIISEEQRKGLMVITTNNETERKRNRSFISNKGYTHGESMSMSSSPSYNKGAGEGFPMKMSKENRDEELSTQFRNRSFDNLESQYENE